jgi:diaminopimelate decarboxylase
LIFFPYRAGVLHAEEMPLTEIADHVGTPFYCYSDAAIRAHFSAYRTALDGLDVDIYYSLKANSNQAVIATLGSLGAGADVVSLGEMHRALKAGIEASRIVFAGVGKTREEMAQALEAGIHQFNVESDGELQALDEVARSLGRRAPVALRINPDIDAKTHAKIATGKSETKFGIDIDHAAQVYSMAARLPGIELVGLSCHIGSQLTDIGPFRAAFARIAELARSLRGANLPVRRIDLGGGLGIAYHDERTIALGEYAAAIREIIHPLGCKIEIEPGRSIIGNAGLLVARVINVKRGATRTFVIVDAAMNDLIRPTLYEAYHDIVPVKEPADGAPVARVDVAGPVCETGDLFAEQRPLPPLAPGDLVAFRSAGAYGAVMSSTYNTRLPAAEVMVRGAHHAIVRPRPTYEAIIGLDRVPEWLSPRR